MTQPQPLPDFAAARRAMIEGQLRPDGVTDARVLAAMGTVPREQYVPESVRTVAYADRPLPLGEGRALMPPAALARLLAELAPVDGERALVVGAGSGYAAALLGEMGLHVDQTDRHASPKGQYDIILIDGAVEHVPDDLVARLAPDGRLGTAILDRGVSRLAVGRSAAGTLGLESFADAEVPVLAGFERPRVFVF